MKYQCPHYPFPQVLTNIIKLMVSEAVWLRMFVSRPDSIILRKMNYGTVPMQHQLVVSRDN